MRRSLPLRGSQTVQFAAVILIGLGLLVWILTATRYSYYESSTGQIFRDDAWTRTRQYQVCREHVVGTQRVNVCAWETR